MESKDTMVAKSNKIIVDPSILQKFLIKDRAPNNQDGKAT